MSIQLLHRIRHLCLKDIFVNWVIGLKHKTEDDVEEIRAVGKVCSVHCMDLYVYSLLAHVHVPHNILIFCNVSMYMCIVWLTKHSCIMCFSANKRTHRYHMCLFCKHVHHRHMIDYYVHNKNTDLFEIGYMYDACFGFRSRLSSPLWNIICYRPHRKTRTLCFNKVFMC